MAYTFSQMALEHQFRFMKHRGISLKDTQSCLLSEADAQAYRNFCIAWPDLKRALELEFPYEQDKLLYRHLTHRKVVAVNFFMPLKLLFISPVVVDWIGALTCQNIKYIRMPQFDVPYSTQQPYLDGQTLFDVFIEAETVDGEELGIGICLQYAEVEDQCRPSQKHLMFEEYNSSCYKPLSEVVGYEKDKLDILRSEGVNYLWRHHLLGFELIERRELDRFVMLYIYPQQNLFLDRAATLFLGCVPYLQHHTYKVMPLELLIKDARSNLTGFKRPVYNWLDYMRNRFIPTFG